MCYTFAGVLWKTLIHLYLIISKFAPVQEYYTWFLPKKKIKTFSWPNFNELYQKTDR